MRGGSCIGPGGSADQVARSSPPEPPRRSPPARQAAASAGSASSVGATWSQAFGLGGLTMPAMCPPLLRTNRTGPLTRPVVLYEASHGKMWSLIALTTDVGALMALRSIVFPAISSVPAASLL